MQQYTPNRFIKNQLNNSLSISIMISTFLIYIFLNLAFEFPYNNKITAILSLSIIILTFLHTYKNITKLSYIILALIIVLAIPFAAVKGRTVYQYYLLYWTLVAFATSLLFQYSKPNIFLLSLPFYTITITIFIGIFFLNETMTVETGDLYFFLINRNTVAMFAYSYALVPFICKYIQKKISITFELINLSLLLIVQSLTRSRAGLLIAVIHSIFVIYFLFHRFIRQENELPKRKEKFSKILIYGVLIIGLLMFITVIQSRLFQTEYKYDENGFISSERILIYKSYFQELTLKKFLFGYNPSMYSITHMHNSILELLVRVGFIGTLPVFLLLGLSFYRLMRKSYLLAGIFLLLMMYSMVEYYVFFLQGDFALLPLIIYANSSLRQNSISSLDEFNSE